MKRKLNGYWIVGSAVGGVKSLLFKTRAEALRFTKKVGGRVVKKTKTF